MDLFNVLQREFIIEVLVVLVKKLIVKEVLKRNIMSMMTLRVTALAGSTDSRGIAVIL